MRQFLPIYCTNMSIDTSLCHFVWFLYSLFSLFSFDVSVNILILCTSLLRLSNAEIADGL